MSLDRYLEQPYADEAYRDNEYSEAYEEQVDYIEKCFKANQPIKYSGTKQLHIDHCDFYDIVFQEQAEILRLMANKDDAGLLKKMQELYQKNMDSLIDLTIG